MGINYYNDVQDKLSGLWVEVLSMYGIVVGEFKGRNTKNASCPCCGGDDRAHWRETNGRLSLFCRSCAADSMLSAEDVILKLTNINFNDFTNQMADYVNHVPLEVINKAKVKARATPSRSTPISHKQNHELVERFLVKCEWCHSMALLCLSVANPQAQPFFNGVDYWPMMNESGVLVNLAKYDADYTGGRQVAFIAGGVSYGSTYEIKGNKKRVLIIDPVDALQFWYKTTASMYVCFDASNLDYCAAAYRDHGVTIAVRCPEHAQDLLDKGYDVRIIDGEPYGKFTITKPVSEGIKL